MTNGKTTRGKTITTYFINGDPKGIKYAIISNHTCKCLVIPHDDDQIDDALKRKELKTPSFYLLLANEDKQVYIGESKNFQERVKQHDDNAFWTEAVVFVATDLSISKTDIQFLEYLAYTQVEEAKLFELKNEQIPYKPHMPEYQRDSILDFFDDVQMLASFLGYTLFETSHVPEDEHLYIKNTNQDIDATGVYENGKLRVFAKSLVRKEPTEAHINKAKRLKLLSENASDKGNFYELDKDILFTSPSAAANFCIGSNVNGWDAWKNKQDKTLATIHNAKLAAAE